MKREITVDYTAPTEIRNPAQVKEYVRHQIQDHLDSVDEYRMSDCELQVDMHTLEFSGKVGMNLAGSIGNKAVEAVIIRVNKPPRIGVRHYKRAAKRVEWRQRNGLAVFFAWMVVESIQGMARCAFPSRLARAVGRPLFSGRVLRSLDECLADIRSQVDETSGRTASGGSERHQVAAWAAILSSIVGVAAAGICYYQHHGPAENPTNTILGILAATWGFSGFVYGGTLFTLPRQYFESERAGRRMLKRWRIKTVTVARSIGLGMCAVSLAVAVLGVWTLWAK